jgi:hypothetical protein
MNIGWVKLHRQFKDWEWYNKSEMVHLFIHCLIKANFKDGSFQGIECKKGSFITSLKHLSDETNISIQTIRTCLKKLQLTKEINVKSTNKLTQITICNYDSYQQETDEANKQLTNNQQTTNKQLTTIEEYKESKEEKEVTITPKNKFSEDIFKFYEFYLKHFEDRYKPENESQKNKWLECIDKLIKIDGLTPREINDIILRGRNDEFWSEQFRTILKLRTKNKEGIPYWKIFNELQKKSIKQNILFTTPDGIEITDKLALHVYQQTGKV